LFANCILHKTKSYFEKKSNIFVPVKRKCSPTIYN
jgi:hypothetical protein